MFISTSLELLNGWMPYSHYYYLGSKSMRKVTTLLLNLLRAYVIPDYYGN